MLSSHPLLGLAALVISSSQALADSWTPAATASLDTTLLQEGLNVLVEQHLQKVFDVPAGKDVPLSHWDSTTVDISKVAAKIPGIGQYAQYGFSTATIKNADLIAKYVAPGASKVQSGFLGHIV